MLRRTASAVVPLAASLAVAACGGGSTSSTTASGASGATGTVPSLSAYCKGLAAPLNVKAPSTFSRSALVTTFGPALAELKALTPPANLQAMNDQLIIGYTKLIKDAKGGNVAAAGYDLHVLGAMRTQVGKACP